MCHVRALEDLELLSCGHSKELGVRCKSQSCDVVSEIEVGNYHLLLIINDQSKAVDINSNQDFTIWRKYDSIDVATVLER